MSPDTTLALVLLGPPALFGLAVALEWWRDEYRARQARRRHPSSRYLDRLEQAAANPLDPDHGGPHYLGCGHAAGIPVEDRPDWGTR